MVAKCDFKNNKPQKTNKNKNKNIISPPNPMYVIM